ncbi:MAG: iron ABC transporter permease [Propionivibrio sp.]
MLFLIVDLWMFSVLRDSHEKTVLQGKKELVTALARSAPGEGSDASVWLSEAKRSYPELHLLFMRGVPGIDDVKEHALDVDLLRVWQDRKAERTFLTAVEAASYLETYVLDEAVRIGSKDSLLVFAPVVNAEGDTAIGVMVAAIDESVLTSFLNLTYALSAIAFALFAVGFGIATFSRDPPTGYAILVLFAIVLVFVAYPLFEAVRLTFVQEGRFSLGIWKEILTNRQYLSALAGSIELGVWTATISTIIGFLFAFFVSRTSMRGKKFVTALATLPVISPPFSLTLSIILLFGNNGLITKGLLGLENFSIYGLTGLTIVQTISMFPIAFLTMVGVLEAIDSTLEDASLDLNATRWQTFMGVTLPLAMPGILSSWLLVFTNSLADFANPLLLSGSFRVLSVESYIEVTGMNRLGNGAALSILLLLPTLTAFFVQRSWVAKKSFVVVTGKPSGRLSDLASKPTRWMLLGFVSLVSLFIVSLYGTIVAGCFVKNWGIDYTFTTENIVEALQRGKDAMFQTMTLAGIATPIAGIIAMIGAVLVVRKQFPGKRMLEALMMTPFAVPGTLVGISYILAFNEPPFLLVGTGAILVICYVIRELPVGLEGGVATLRQIDPAIEEAASDLGADQPTVFRTVILPLIRPAFISSMSYTFVRSMTAVSAIVFLISAKWYHITIQIYNFSENIRFGLASVLATALIFVVLAAFGIMRLLVRKSEHLEKTVTVQ